MSTMDILAACMGSSGVYTGDIGHSLRLRKGASASISRTFGTPTANTSWFLSMWLERGMIDGVTRYLMCAADTGIQITASNQLSLVKDGSVVATSTSYLRVLGFGHLCVRSNGTNVKAYYNNVEIASYTGTMPELNSAIAHYFGRYAVSATGYADEYFARIAWVDGGGSLTPGDFAYLNDETNAWVTKRYAGVKALVDAGGNNSTLLEFSDATSLTTLGQDSSAKGNNWTLTNISITAGPTYDHMLDVPGNSYATLNPLSIVSPSTLSSGNLSFDTETTGGGGIFGTLAIPHSGKYYFECAGTNNVSSGLRVGIGAPSQTIKYIYLSDTGKKFDGTTLSSYGATFANADVIGVEIDCDAGTITFRKNNTSQGVAFTSISLVNMFAYIYDGSGAVGVSGWINFGQRPFTYTPPTGFKALCQANLPDGETIETSGTFTGTLAADGPYRDVKGVPLTMTINGNAVTWGSHADKTAFGFKLRTASSSYNNTGSNTFSITSTGEKRKYSTGQGNP